MNKKYMLDTNIMIYVIKQRPISVLERFLAHDPSEFCISAITSQKCNME